MNKIGCYGFFPPFLSDSGETNVYREENEGEGEVAPSCPTLATPWTVSHQAPLSIGFSRQEYWSGVPLPSPRKENNRQKVSVCNIREKG